MTWVDYLEIKCVYTGSFPDIEAHRCLLKLTHKQWISGYKGIFFEVPISALSLFLPVLSPWWHLT